MENAVTNTTKEDPGRALANQRLFAELLGRVARERHVPRRDRPEYGKGPPIQDNGAPGATDFTWHFPPQSPEEPAPSREVRISGKFDPMLPFAPLVRSDERAEQLSRSRLFEKEDALDRLREIYDVEVEQRFFPALGTTQIRLRDRTTGDVIVEMPYDEILDFLVEARRLAGVLVSASI